MNIENTSLEFKREYTQEIKYEIIAFANSRGGVIKIGVEDDGTVCGVKNISDTYLQLTNSVRDAISPDITMFVRYNITNDGVIEITVSEGTNKPYFIKEKGIKPTGIYVRQGTSSAPASWDQIRVMIKQTDGDKYEDLRSLEQNLTFHYAKNEFKIREMPFDETKYITLGIMKMDKTYSNLGLLISDECKHTIKVAVFDGVEKKVFKSRKEFGGSILKQLRDVFDYLDLVNKTQSTFSGLDRIDKRDYNELIVREALVNAIVHREYSFSGSIIVNVYDNRMEFISLGGLVDGLSEDDIKSGISQTRNEKLANIFFRLKHIETYGYGLPNIFGDYENYIVKPEIKITDNAFVITLPNKKYYHDIDVAAPHIAPTGNQKAVINYIKENGYITRAECERILNVKQSRAYQILGEMLKSNLIIHSPNNKKHYITRER